VQETQAFGIFDDEEGGTVFDGATWVLEFSFAEDVAAGFFRELFQADQRCLSNCCRKLEKLLWALEIQVLPSRKPRCPMP
jgi:hypothetical protein